MLPDFDLKLQLQPEKLSVTKVDVSHINIRSDELILSAIKKIDIALVCKEFPHHCVQFFFLS